MLNLNVTADATYVAQWAKATYTVRFVDWNGRVISTVQVPHGDNAAVPTDPTRSGYTFSGWSSPITNVTADLTVTAQYTLITTTTIIPDEKVPLAAISWLQPYIDAGIPIVSNSVPLMALNGYPTWALINLIMCIVGFVLALIVIARMFARRKTTEKTEERESEKQRKNRMLWVGTTVLMGLLGVIVFFLTENINSHMVLIDFWTIINAIILAAGIIGMVFSSKRKKKEDVHARVVLDAA